MYFSAVCHREAMRKWTWPNKVH